MNWTVTYSPSAEKDLAEIWLVSSDQAEVAQAADEIDRLLGLDPFNAGESRDAGARIVVQFPLAVEFDIREHDRIVTVKAVRKWRRQ
jgi:plasmid stabilization system protein ParE